MDKIDNTTARHINSPVHSYNFFPGETRYKKRKYIFDRKEKTKNISANITLSTVTSMKDFKDFFNAAQHVYKNDHQWIMPFWTEYKDFFKTKNPFWAHADVQLFTAYKNHDVIGRIAAIIDYLYCKT